MALLAPEPAAPTKAVGTDVYTDDSDVLAMCVHAGWSRARAWSRKVSRLGCRQDAPRGVDRPHPHTYPKAGGGERQGQTVRPQRHPAHRSRPSLIAYKGCQRAASRVRSWGNSHDGVSLVVESVELKQPGYAHGKGRRSAKGRIDQLAAYRSVVEGAARKQAGLEKVLKETQMVRLADVVKELKDKEGAKSSFGRSRRDPRALMGKLTSRNPTESQQLWRRVNAYMNAMLTGQDG